MRSYALALVVSLLCAALPLDAAAAGQADWQRFRAEYPYHIQAIALGAAGPGGRTLVVAEPPPSVTLAELQQGWPREFESATIARHRVGAGGWVADVVTRLPPQSDEATRELVEQLSGYLFGTSYKSYALTIGGPAAARRENLDLAVSTGQLASWFGLRPQKRSGGSKFVDAVLGIGALITFIGALRTRRLQWVVRGALVAGAIVVKARIDEPPPPDVLFVERHHTRAAEAMPQIMNGGGGLYDSERRGLVLFVLPRSASLDSYRSALREFVLDTDSILGAVGTGRTIAIVGRERTEPVSLMPPLRVETLLQLASVTSTELSQSDERRNLLAGYSEIIGGFELLAFARPGSLPVDHLGRQDARLGDAEDIADEYFASSRDPHLARVVQYAGAYQIFRAFEIGATNPYTTPPDSLDRRRMEALAISALAMPGSEDAGRFADHVAQQQNAEALRDVLRRQLQGAAPRVGPVHQVLKLGDTPIAERGLGVHTGVPVSPATWRQRRGIQPGHAATLQTLQRPGRLGIVIERQEGGILMAVGGEASTIFADDTRSAIDAFVTRTAPHGRGTLRVEVTFRNFEVDQARHFIRSAELYSLARPAAQINAVVDVTGNIAGAAH